jgi:hypothetical protein
VIPSKDLEEFSSADEKNLSAILEAEIISIFKDIKHEMPVTFKITNLPRRNE